jgi:hypothetical protein
MSGIERRLTKLEAASGHTAHMPVFFITLVPVERDLPVTATVDGSVWHREPDEPEEAFVARVGREARLAWQGNRVLVAFLHPPCGRDDPRPEGRGEAAGGTDVMPRLTSRSKRNSRLA